MERTFSPMIRQFSAIDGLQKAYTLVYSMDTGNENGCCLTLCRTGNRQYMQSCYIAAAPEFCYRILRYLCENGVQPEIWQDVVEELTDTEPVSYTHLRAHETDSYLVCRLLLEKKKKNKKQWYTNKVIQ